MTIFDAKTALFNYFTANQIFDLEKDFKKIVPISEDVDIDKAIIYEALSDMDKAELVRKMNIVTSQKPPSMFPPCRLAWVLTQSLDSYTQNVSLNRATISAIISFLNAAAEDFKNDSLLVDPLHVQEKDIQNLLLLLQNALKK